MIVQKCHNRQDFHCPMIILFFLNDTEIKIVLYMIIIIKNYQ